MHERSTVAPYSMQVFDNKINELYASLHKAPELLKRLSSATQFFLGQEYAWEPLGEGVQGKYDQAPLYRTDRFDCVTFTNTILSVIHSQGLDEFKKNMLAIRYKEAKINYVNRTDWFTDLEWLPNAEKKGWLKDITQKIVDKNGKKIALTAQTIIDKPNWYKVRPMNSIRLLSPLKTEQAQQLLQALHQEGAAFSATASTLSYLPLNILFNAQGEPEAFYFEQLPRAMVVVIVRPNWQIRDDFAAYPQGYGSNLNVSHLGIAIRNEHGLMFYHASRNEKKVIVQPLIEYLREYLQSETIKGIHVEEIAIVA